MLQSVFHLQASTLLQPCTQHHYNLLCCKCAHRGVLQACVHCFTAVPCHMHNGYVSCHIIVCVFLHVDRYKASFLSSGVCTKSKQC